MATATAAAFPPISRRSSPAIGSRGRWRCGARDRKLVRTLLIDNYDSYTYNIFQDLAVINGVPPVVMHNDEWTWDYLQHQLYDEMAFDNIVISPGPGSPTCPADVGVCLEVLLKCEDLPILGVCLGHQALGFIHGAQIVHASEPIHGRLSEIEHTGCYLFDGIPSGRKSGFKVVRYHSLIIDHDTLPKDLIPIAWTVSRDAIPFLEIQDPKANDPHNYRNQFAIDCLEEPTSQNMKLLMGIRHSTRPHYGLQFHPESIATRHGRQIFKNFKKLTVNHGLRSSAHPQRKVSFEHNLRNRVTNGRNGKLHSKFSSQYLSTQNPATKLPVRRKTKHLKLQWRKFGKLASQVGGPENIFLGLFGNLNGKDTFWLDSSSTEMRRARFSFMGGKGGQLWKQLSFWLCNHRSNHGGYLTIQDATGLEETTYLEDGFLDFLEKELQSFQYNKEDFQGLPFDFHGGFVGFIGYDMKIECGASSNIHKSTKPDACLFFVDNLVVIDHRSDDVYILSIHSSDTGEAEKQKWLDETERRLLDLKALAFRKMHKTKSQSTIPSKSLKPGFLVAKSRDQYVNDVKKCLQFIRDGESYELCLTTQMKMKSKNLNALELYLDLRKQNPAPYAAWLNFSKEKLSICCSSPERFLQLDGTGILEAKPIKGTISRGTTPEEDEHQKNKLRSSEKDQAENLMIVDLLRNDLGRVCEPGTVHVPCLMDVESYATVHTLVSTIRGRKKAGLSSVDCVKAAFPGGSMTGAPKLRSMELLDSLECCSRGVYSGSIGFFSYNQTFDLNIVIRTVVVHDDEASIGAGGAVVALSNPEDEYDEMVLKAKAPTKAVERQCNKMDSPDGVVMAKESKHLLSH